MPVTIHHDKQKEAYDFLKTHPVGVLATTDPNGEPYAAAIYFTVMEGRSGVSFVTKTQTKKADNLEHNSHAMLVVYDAATQTMVQLAGTVTKVTDLVAINEVLTAVIYASIDTSGSSVPPIAKLNEGEYVAYTLVPNQVRMAVFTHSKAGGYSDIFTTISSGIGRR